ncbi:MAG: polyphosphate polymerase domain-containing protein [Lachnospiraceae bacterium]|nr:polyphosphate polymerase domain-containing protein [Lachnospiraceae bacterium]
MRFLRYQNPFANRKGRHEIKILLTYPQYVELRARVSGIMTPDPNMPGPEGYLIRSVYLDTMKNDAYYEKDSGVEHRNKYRIRAYNGSDELIMLENKEKIDDRIIKTGARITRADYDAILRGDFSVLGAYDDPLCKDVLARHSSAVLTPKVIVEYYREAFIHPLSKVRVTFDRLVAAGVNTLDMFDEKLYTSPVFGQREVVLEVKYDDAFPMYLKQLLTNNGIKLAISKFVMCSDKLKNNYIVLR